MRLLQVSWTELLTLQLSFRSIPVTGKLNFASDFWLDDKSAKECGATELYNHVSSNCLFVSLNFFKINCCFQCLQISQRLEKLSISKEDYYLVKALSLSNCDIRLDNLGALRKIRDSILGALNDCVFIQRFVS